MATSRYAVETGGQEEEVTLERLEDGRVRLTHAGRTVVLDARRVAGEATGRKGAATTWSVRTEDGAHRLVDVEGVAPDLQVTAANLTVPYKITDARLRGAGRAGAAAGKKGPLAVRSPMPGRVVRLLVKVGDEVKSGQGVAVVEAMKMENELKAPRDGKVVELKAKEGQAVESNEILVTLE